MPAMRGLFTGRTAPETGLEPEPAGAGGASSGKASEYRERAEERSRQAAERRAEAASDERRARVQERKRQYAAAKAHRNGAARAQQASATPEQGAKPRDSAAADVAAEQVQRAVEGRKGAADASGTSPAARKSKQHAANGSGKRERAVERAGREARSTAMAEKELAALMGGEVESEQDEAEALERALTEMSDDDSDLARPGAPRDDIEALMETLKAMGDDDADRDLLAEINAIPDEDEAAQLERELRGDAAASPASVAELEGREKEAKAAALSAKRSGDMDAARVALRELKLVRAQLEEARRAATESADAEVALAEEAEATKRAAVEHKRAGRLDEAKGALRRYKQLKAALDAQSSSGGAVPQSAGAVELSAPLQDRNGTEVPDAASSTELGALAGPDPAVLHQRALRRAAAAASLVRKDALEHRRAGRMVEARAALERFKTLRAHAEGLERGDEPVASEPVSRQRTPVDDPQAALSEARRAAQTADAALGF